MTPISSKSRPDSRPAKDEWGMYDPEQAGLAALFARLDGAAEPARPAEPADSTRSRVLSDTVSRRSLL